MPRLTPLIATTNGGEWSPLLYGRIDMAKYQNAARRLVNMIPLAEGPCTHRPGTRHVCPTKAQGRARLIPFEFSTEQAYIIEAGAGYFRFYKDRGQILSGSVPYEIANPYGDADLDGLKWCQSADILYLFHPSYQTRKLSRTGHTSWTLTLLDPSDGPWLDVNATDTTLTPSATTGSITLTASATTNINGGAGFKSTDVGRQIRLKHTSPTKWGWGKITAVASTTSVTVSVQRDFGSTSATKDWRLGAWSDTTGWPSCGRFFEERLFAAATRSRPQTFWSSVSGDYETFSVSDPDGTVAADHGIIRTLSDDRVNAIRWLSAAGDTLSCGCSGGEFIVRASTLGEALTPDNVTVKRSTTRGSADMMAVAVDASVLYVQASARKIHELAYSIEADGYRSPDMTLLAAHIARQGFAGIAYQKEPWGILWGHRKDGLLVGMTYLREQDVVAWHRHPLGGSFQGGSPMVESIATIPGNGQDEVWLEVKRTVNGQTVRHIEFMEYQFWPENDSDRTGAFFVDAGLSYSGAAVAHFTGLDHLEGETVNIIADGANAGTQTVTGGAITLQYAASAIDVGLYADAEYETMNLEYGSNDGTAVGKVKRVSRVSVSFWASADIKAGLATDANLDTLPLLVQSQWSVLPDLYTGPKELAIGSGWDTQARILIRQDMPLPVTVTGIAPVITINGG